MLEEAVLNTGAVYHRGSGKSSAADAAQSSVAGDGSIAQALNFYENNLPKTTAARQGAEA
jgi:hypothetical protein